MLKKKKKSALWSRPQQTQGATAQKKGGRAVESNRQLRMLYTSVTSWEDNSPPPTEMGGSSPRIPQEKAHRQPAQLAWGGGRAENAYVGRAG